MSSISQRRQTFRQLHQRGCFVIPNPWDIGSALLLQDLGFEALASTSAGFAFSRGLADTAVPRDVALAHLRELVEAVSLPVNADFENGFADDPEELAVNVGLCVETGVAGLSVEDSTGDRAKPLYEFKHAVDRIRAARAGMNKIDPAAMLVARTEEFFLGRGNLAETIRRLQAFAEAGADCLYAPGVSKRDDLRAIVQAVSPKPVNALIGAPGGLTVADVAEIGARRVSVGGALARVALGAFIKAARELHDNGTFGGFTGATSYADLNAFFGKSGPAKF